MPSISFDKNARYVFTGVPSGADAMFLSDLAKDQKKPVLFIARDEHKARAIMDALEFFAPSLPRHHFPAWDTLPYDRLSPSPDNLSERLKTLSNLALLKGDKESIIVTSVAAVMQKLQPVASLKNRSLHIKRGGTLNAAELQNYFLENGFRRTGTVRDVGEFAIRGDIIDLYPSQDEEPYRIDLFDQTIEKITQFDPLSQLRSAEVDAIELFPVQEVILTKDAIANFRSAYRETFGADASNDAIYESISEGKPYAGMEHWLPFYYEKLASFFDYLPGALLILDDQYNFALNAQEQDVAEYYTARHEYMKAHKKGGDAPYRPVDPKLLFLSPEEFEAQVKKLPGGNITPASQSEGDAIPYEAKQGRNYAGEKIREAGSGEKALAAMTADIAHLLGQQKKVVIAAYSNGSRERLIKLFAAQDLRGYQKAETLQDMDGPGLYFALLKIEHGFERKELSIIAEADILGDRLSRPAKRERRAENFIQEASALHPGDLVVHMDHGVGRFLGLETVMVDDIGHDCLRLEYLGGDKLFVPVENIEVLSRYGNEDSSGHIDKLGSASWQSRKARVKERLREMAEQLIKLAAERLTKQADTLPAPKGYDEFCARFPYAETEDQLRAIADMERDLAASKPMDRLVCGDVGFGKTEVALRAAFIAAANGVQVAVVVPTTLLARQHYKNFVQRFEGFPIRIAQLSRLVAAGDAKQIKEDLAEHRVDIVIGTHALLTKNIAFKHLGLLIVDEEQHFGVAQKERLKELQHNVHVLTLTATPIPRTLQMALTGVRDLSIIATPPVDRLAVQTQVMPFDPVIVKEAIQRERHRGGQSFYVCPRVEDLEKVAARLRDLVPDIKFAIAHGQMPPTRLEETIASFLDRKYDMLLSTNIIESGLDIPTANTMIIHRADMFGLSQLYQLRGRVGRSKTRAFAYLTLPERHVPTPSGQKRLEVMQTLDHLGAGFTVASHDMDIRGAGNLLGEEQSGHVREVGIELYQSLLQEAVADVKSGVKTVSANDVVEPFSPQINLGMPVMIPESYVADLATRLSLYRRLGTLKQKEEIDAFASELIDRFGDLPAEVENLLDVVMIKNMCLRAGIEKIDAGPKGAVVSFYKNRFQKPEKLIAYIQEQRGTAKVRPDQRLVLMRGWNTPKDRLSGVNEFMREIVNLAA